MEKYSTILKIWPNNKDIFKKKQMNKPPALCQIKFSLNGMEGLPVISVKAIEWIFFFFLLLFNLEGNLFIILRARKKSC